MAEIYCIRVEDMKYKPKDNRLESLENSLHEALNKFKEENYISNLRSLMLKRLFYNFIII